ncbi:bar adaptor protein [Niveomyces insectorum RCEF 264]|uniref:Bar adaptor protein n=1 Tax=Niveomyces insectorum RCEF 264 TaxID=1081102 RepID=A0A167Q7E4_9HYPO|nr:bar adaptor protein [Niveomyces insectorum RCEF 264]
MSFKGFQKSVVRAPQQLRAKFNLGEQSKDPIYSDAERRFQELERETKKLHDESQRYADAINGMLAHQIEFSQAMTEIYKPISGSVSDPDSFVVEAANAAGIRACEEYEAVVKDLQATLKPELEMIEQRVVQPADELLAVVKGIRKTAVKRDHKKLDYDRHRAALKKLQEKKEKSLKDEKAMYKAEADLEQSTQDFDYFNDLLKEELPRLFALERQFIQPLFQSFYYMQLNVFYTLHERMQRCDIGYFDLTLDVEAAFEKKRGDIQAQTEKLSIVRFRVTSGGKRPPAGQSKYGPPRHTAAQLEGGRSRPLAITAGGETPTYGQQQDPTAEDADPYAYRRRPSSSDGLEGGRSRPLAITAGGETPTYGQQQDPTAEDADPYAYRRRPSSSDGVENPPPPYSATASTSSPPPSSSHAARFSAAFKSAGNGLSAAAAAATGKAKPPPPKPKPSKFATGAAPPLSPKPPAPPAPPASAAGTVTALYDYAAAQEGDLSFKAGDVIEVVTRTDNPNEWWVGRLHGREGQFPGNYVQVDG